MDPNYNDTNYGNFHESIQVLDLTTGLIKSKNMNTNLTCALCQQQETTDLETIANSFNGRWEDMFNNCYNVKLVSSEKYKTAPTQTEESKTNMAHEIALKLGGVQVQDVVYQSSTLNLNGYLEIDFHYHENTLNGSLLPADNFQNVSLNAKYVMSVEDISDCPEESVANSEGGVTVWKSDILSSGQVKLDLTDWLATKRQCVFNVAADRPLWGTPSVWQIVHEPCSDIEQYADRITYERYLDPSVEYNQKHQLKRFTGSPTSVKGLAEVASLTSREIRAANELSTEMHDDLTQILVELQTDGNMAIVQEPSVNFVVADLTQKGNDVDGFTMSFQETGLGMFVEPVTLALNKAFSPNVTDPLPTVSLTVSSGLIDNSDRVAFATFWKPVNPWGYQTDDSKRYLEVDVILAGPKVSLSTAAGFVDIAYDIKDVSGANNVSCGTVANDDVMSMGNYSKFDDLFPKECAHLESNSSTTICVDAKLKVSALKTVL